MAEVEQILKECTVEGTVVRLPQTQLDGKTYQEVAKKLELIGGKWKGGKIAGFVFPNDPTELLSQIQNGEKRNLKKEYQFLATPAPLADELVELAGISTGLTFLEPSAGRGALVEAILRECPNSEVDCFELMDINQLFLEKIEAVNLVGADFLSESGGKKYDRIIANPPFSKNQDIDHILKMYDCLSSGGRLVSVASKHWQHAQNKKETSFRDWLKKVGASIIEVPGGTFQESGTSIASCIIVIDK